METHTIRVGGEYTASADVREESGTKNHIRRVEEVSHPVIVGNKTVQNVRYRVFTDVDGVRQEGAGATESLEAFAKWAGAEHTPPARNVPSPGSVEGLEVPVPSTAGSEPEAEAEAEAGIEE